MHKFKSKFFNQENVIFLTINKTIAVMHRRVGYIDRNRVGCMINEESASLKQVHIPNIYIKQVH